MFTREESALLGRMLRVAGWAVLCVAVAIAAAIVWRFEHGQSTAAHHAVPVGAHGHFS
jgi:tryptophan-rich sensory protein